MPVRACSKIPDIEIEEAELDFGGITFGDSKTLPLTVYNNSDIPAKLLLDIREHPEFEIILPPQDQNDDVVSEIMVAIQEDTNFKGDIENMNPEEDPLNDGESIDDEDNDDDSDEDNVTITVTIDTTPVATPSAIPSSGSSPLNVTLLGDFTGGESPYEFFWDLGDGSNSTEQYLTHIYQNPGNYTAEFTVTDDDGDFDTESVAITVF